MREHITIWREVKYLDSGFKTYPKYYEKKTVILLMIARWHGKMGD